MQRAVQGLSVMHACTARRSQYRKVKAAAAPAHLEDIGDHAARVAQRVLLADVVADQALVVGVVERRAQVAWAEHLALA